MSEFEKSNRGESASSIIKNHMIWSMGAGFIPVPIADLFAVSAIQLDMIRQLCKVYDIDFKQTEGKAMITAAGRSSCKIYTWCWLYSRWSYHGCFIRRFYVCLG